MTNGPPDQMADVTFTIPVRIDSADRLGNLLAVLRVLRTTYPSRIIVGSEEAETLRTVVPRGVEVISTEGPMNLPFHHTRVLNDLGREVTTPVLVNIETDIVVPEPQLREAVRRTAGDEFDLVLPYDFAVDVARHERATFIQGAISAASADGRTKWPWRVIGGCVVWRTDAFRALGMENEHFISWGLEDDERLVRVRRLGGRSSRITGPLFHLEHVRGADSSERTPYYINNQAELARVRSRKPEQMATEVAAWAWKAATTSRPITPVPAADLTVTIPVRIDHPDRLRNLVAAVRAVRNTTTARVLIGIGDPSMLDGYLPHDVDVLAVSDLDGPFHRTRILNELARASTTEFVANHDADVVVPMEQWRDALARLRANADLVLPYGGEMVSVPYAHHPWLERAAYDSMPSVLQGVLHPASVGGCVVWRRTAFLDAGMENEHFISWGAEDDERVGRAERLGMSVQRCAGVLYHLNHARGADSGEENPRFAANLAERDRIAAMTSRELRAEIATWPWRGGDGVS